MIVSHRHSFIFIKTHKTAGTSIELILSDLAGPDAIVTPVTPPEGGHHPRNYTGHWSDSLRWISSHPNGRVHAIGHLATDRRVHRTQGFYNHMPAWLVRARLGKQRWDSYYKFCFERNPWEKMVSLYDWLTRNSNPRPDFEDWLRTDPRAESDWPLYEMGGACAVDRIGRFESLNDDLSDILGEIGLASDSIELAHAKGGIHRSEALYSQDGISRIARKFQNEIEMFQYECPEALRA